MNLYYKIKWKIKDAYWGFRKRCQRFKRGYSWGDVWDMDIWFMETIKPMLIHLRDYGIGCPAELYNEEDDSGEAWKKVLTEMIDCLEFMDEDKVYERLGFGDLDSRHRIAIEDIKTVYNIRENNKNRFFELFSKHFYDLWD